MATTPNDVERIDVIEGPNLDELMRAFKFAPYRPDGFPEGMSVRFEEVVFFGEDDKEIDGMGKMFHPKIVGVRYLGNQANSATRDDFVITVRSWRIFEGHYNTHSRKGSLSAL